MPGVIDVMLPHVIVLSAMLSRDFIMLSRDVSWFPHHNLYPHLP